MARALWLAVVGLVTVLAPGLVSHAVGAAEHPPASATATGSPAAATRVAPQPAPTPRPPSATFTVWQWNVAGNAMHAGSTTDGLVEVAVASIVRTGADLVALNELCEQQFDSVQSGLVVAGWGKVGTRFSAFAPTIPSGSPKVCAGRAYGIGLFSRSPLGAVDQLTLPDDGSEEARALLCARLARPSGVEFCTTHITTSDAPSTTDGRPADVDQLDAVLARLETDRARGRTVLIAGDFNAQPNYARLDGWYTTEVQTTANGRNTGAYDELGDSDPGSCPGYGEWTATGPPGAAPPCGGTAVCSPATTAGCGKIDMIFVRRDRIVGRFGEQALAIPTTCPGVPARSGVYGPGACSDHRILTGTVTVRTG